MDISAKLRELKEALQKLGVEQFRPLRELFERTGTRYAKEIEYSRPISLILHVPEKYFEPLTQQIRSQPGVVSLDKLLRNVKNYIQTLVYATPAGQLKVLASVRGTFWNQYIMRQVETEPELILGQKRQVQFAQLPVQWPQTGIIAQSPVPESVMNVLVYQHPVTKFKSLTPFTEAAHAFYRKLVGLKPISRTTAEELAQKRLQQAQRQQLRPEQKFAEKVSKELSRKPTAQRRIEDYIYKYLARPESELFKPVLSVHGTTYVRTLPQRIAFQNKVLDALVAPIQPSRTFISSTWPQFVLPKPPTFEEIIRQVQGLEPSQLSEAVRGTLDVLNRNISAIQELSQRLRAQEIEPQQFFESIRQLLQPLTQYRTAIEQMYEQTQEPQLYRLRNIIQALETGETGQIRPESISEQLNSQMNYLASEHKIGQVAGLTEQYLTRFGTKVTEPEQILQLLATGKSFQMYVPQLSPQQYKSVLEAQQLAGVEPQEIIERLTRQFMEHAGKANQQRLIYSDMYNYLKSLQPERLKEQRRVQFRLGTILSPPSYVLQSRVQPQMVLEGETAYPQVIVQQQQSGQFVFLPKLEELRGKKQYVLLSTVPERFTPTELQDLGQGMLEAFESQEIKVGLLKPKSIEEIVVHGQKVEYEPFKYKVFKRQIEPILVQQPQVPTEQALASETEVSQQILEESESTRAQQEAKITQAELQQAEQIEQTPQSAEVRSATPPTEQPAVQADLTQTEAPEGQTAVTQIQSSMQKIQDQTQLERLGSEQTEIQEGILTKFFRRFANALFGNKYRTMATLATTAAVAAIQLTGQAQRQRVRRDLREQIAKHQMMSQLRPSRQYTVGAIKAQVNTYGQYYDQRLQDASNRVGAYGRTEVSVNRYR